MELEKEESGFYLGTTSMGYVLAILVVLLPVCILVIKEVVGLWLGVTIGVVGSLVLCVATYPILLCGVMMLYYLVQAEELPENQEALIGTDRHRPEH